MKLGEMLLAGLILSFTAIFCVLVVFSVVTSWLRIFM